MTSHPQPNDHNLNMPKPPSLTLILAATPSLGIGKNGTLPWPNLKKEMGYFARVTKRTAQTSGSTPINAVLMGRKTWDSIPASFRPLKDRLNIVLTRDPDAFKEKLGSGDAGVLVASSILDACRRLEERSDVERVFVIGGASVYRAALELPATKRVLLTKIGVEYECDTFFPVDLEESEVWRRAGVEAWREFTGEEESVGEEKGVGFEFCLFEREGRL